MAELIIKITGDADEFQEELDKVTKASENLEKQLATISKVSGIAFAALTATAGLTVKAFIDIETALTGVAKTADLGKDELKEFEKQIESLALTLPVSQEQLINIAESAGQLGVTGVKNLTKFADTIAKLGVASDLEGQQAATVLTRILNVTGEGVETIDKFASVIVALGNSFAATESEIARVTNEVARNIGVFGASAAEAAALGAALRSLGIRAEGGGTAIGRAFQSIQTAIEDGGAGLDELIKLTGLTVDELRKQFSEDAIGVFQKFIVGLDGVAKSGGTVSKSLAALGLKSTEILKVLPVLAQNSDELARALAIANKETKNATALNDEAARAFETTASQLQILQNNFFNIAKQIGAEFAPVVKAAVGITTDFLRTLQDPGFARFAAIMLGIGIVFTGLVTVLAVTALALLKVRTAFIAAGLASKAFALKELIFQLATTNLSLNTMALSLRGNVIKGFASFVKGARAAGVGLRALKISIRSVVGATGIGLLLIALTELVLNFDSSIAFITAAWKGMIQFLTLTSGALAKLLKGDIVGAFKDLQEGLTSGFDEFVRTQDRLQAELKAKQLEADRAAAEARGEQERDLADQNLEDKLARQDESFSILQENERILAELAAEQNLELSEKDKKEFLKIVKTKEQLQKEAEKKRLKTQIEANNLFLDNQRRFGTFIAEIDRIINSQRVQAAKSISGELIGLQRSSNGALKALGQAAAVTQITIDTAASAVSISKKVIEALPFPINIPIAIALAGARIAFGGEQIGKVLTAQTGGIVPKLPGVSGTGDSTLVRAQPGELIVPRDSTQEIIDQAASQKAAETAIEEDTQDIQEQMISIGFDGDEAEQVITARQNEAGALGTSEAI